MARNHSRRQEAKRDAKEMREQERRRPEHAREARAGERADYLHVRAGNADYSTPVKRDLERLHGRSTSDVADDRERGAGSPLDEPARRKRR
jgi:hypothetical protein